MPPHVKGKKLSRYDGEDGKDDAVVVLDGSDDEEVSEKRKAKKHKHRHHHHHHHLHHRHENVSSQAGVGDSDDSHGGTDDRILESRRDKKKKKKDKKHRNRSDDDDDDGGAEDKDSSSPSKKKEKKDKKHRNRSDDDDDDGGAEDKDSSSPSKHRKKKSKKSIGSSHGRQYKGDVLDSDSEAAKKDSLNKHKKKKKNKRDHDAACKQSRDVDTPPDKEHGVRETEKVVACKGKGQDGSPTPNPAKAKRHDDRAAPGADVGDRSRSAAGKQQQQWIGESVCDATGAVDDGDAEAIKDRGVEKRSSAKKPASSQSRRHSSMLSHRGALGLATTCQMQPSEFHDFVCARAFDVISGGMYRKFLVQSRAAKEDWAFSVYASIGKVQKIIKMISGVVHTLKCLQHPGGGDDASRKKACDEPPMALSTVLSETMNSSSPPCRKRVDAIRVVLAKIQSTARAPGDCQAVSSPAHVAPLALGHAALPVRCCVTGVELDEDCVEVRPMTKATTMVQMVGASDECADSASAGAQNAKKVRHTTLHPPLVVHTNLEHFFFMFWFAYKIEHIVRNMARCWMDENDISCPISSAHASQTPVPRGSADNDDDDDDDREKEEEEEEAKEVGASSESVTLKAPMGDEATAAGPSSPSLSSEERVPKNTTAEDGTQAACERFSTDQASVIRDMHNVFRHAVSHVVDSLYGFPALASVHTDDDAGKTSSSGGARGGGKSGSSLCSKSGDGGGGGSAKRDRKRKISAVLEEEIDDGVVRTKACKKSTPKTSARQGKGKSVKNVTCNSEIDEEDARCRSIITDDASDESSSEESGGEEEEEDDDDDAARSFGLEEDEEEEE